MTDLQRLLALEELKSLKARYFRLVDSKDFDGFEALFTPDAVLDLGDDIPGCVVTGAKQIREMTSAALTGAVGVHHGHCPEIELTSDTTARGIWAMEDMVRWSEDTPSQIRTFHGYGHYVETYERVEGRWLFKTVTLKRLRVDIERKT